MNWDLNTFLRWNVNDLQNDSIRSLQLLPKPDRLGLRSAEGAELGRSGARMPSPEPSEGAKVFGVQTVQERRRPPLSHSRNP